MIAKALGVLTSSIGRAAVCTSELGCWCCCRAVLSMPVCALERCLWSCAHWSLGAGAAAMVRPINILCYLGSMLARFAGPRGIVEGGASIRNYCQYESI